MTKQPFLMIALAAVVGVGGLAFGLSQSPAGSGQSLFKFPAFNQPAHVVRNDGGASGPPATGLAYLEQLDQTFAGISEEAAASVVSIANSSGGSGSGFVYRSDGWIVTNDHVVGNSDVVQVTLPDGRTLKGKVIKSQDPQLDLSVVKIDTKDLVALPMANSDEVRVGEFAIAVGSPFGLDDTVTIGHVSALGRGSTVQDQASQVSRGYAGLIQTDASINPGNSGGPLVNIHGEVIGVNSTIVSTTQASAGIGFSIPSNVVRAVADELITNGKFDRGVLGAFIRELKPIEKKELSTSGGAMIDDVVEGTPAGKAGLQAKDVVTSFNGQAVKSELGLRIMLYKASPGDEVTVSYLRDGSTRSAKLKLETPEPQQQAQNFAPEGMQQFPFGNMDQGQGQNESPMMPQGPVQLGIGVRELDETTRNQFKLPADTKGLVILTVSPNSFADRMGAKPGDVLAELNGEVVTTRSDIQKILQDVSWGDPVTIVFSRFEGGKFTRITQTRRIR
ncbi:MAG: trypsin-like peptidase domain-containing protein [Fimbriimonadaceae bacterium]